MDVTSPHLEFGGLCFRSAPLVPLPLPLPLPLVAVHVSYQRRS